MMLEADMRDLMKVEVNRGEWTKTLKMRDEGNINVIIRLSFSSHKL